MKCFDDKTENRPTIKELYQLLSKWNKNLMIIKKIIHKW